MTKVFAVNEAHAAAIRRAYPDAEVEVRSLSPAPRCHYCSSDAVAALDGIQACNDCGMTSPAPSGGAA